MLSRQSLDAYWVLRRIVLASGMQCAEATTNLRYEQLKLLRRVQRWEGTAMIEFGALAEIVVAMSKGRLQPASRSPTSPGPCVDTFATGRPRDRQPSMA